MLFRLPSVAGLDCRCGRRNFRLSTTPRMRFQRFAWSGWIRDEEVAIFLRWSPRQRIERQPQPDRRITRQQEHRIGTHRPATAGPTRLRLPPLTPQRQHKTGDFAKAAFGNASQPRPLFGILQFVVASVDVDWKLPLFRDVVPHVFIRRHGEFGIDVQSFCERCDEPFRVLRRVAVVLAFFRDEIEISPDRLAIASPKTGEGPSG